jgi:hypothetical protein
MPGDSLLIFMPGDSLLGLEIIKSVPGLPPAFVGGGEAILFLRNHSRSQVL